MDGSKMTTSRHFNSQPHKEADEFTVTYKDFSIKFQFTASQGG